MALTPEQKETNKEAFLLRKAAHSARVAEYEAAISIVEDGLSAQRKAADDVSSAQNSSIKQRDMDAEVIRSKMRQLQEELDHVLADHGRKIDTLWAAGTKAYADLYAAREAAVDEVDKKFSDISGNNRFSGSASWTPPAGYIEKFAADNAESIAKKKAKRDVKLSKKKGTV